MLYKKLIKFTSFLLIGSLISCGNFQVTSGHEKYSFENLKSKNDIPIPFFDFVYDSEYLKELFEKPKTNFEYDNYDINIVEDLSNNFFLENDFSIFLDVTFYKNEEKIIKRYNFKNFNNTNLDKYLDLSLKIQNINLQLKKEFSNMEFKNFVNLNSEELKNLFTKTFDDESLEYFLTINYELSNYDYITLTLNLNFKNETEFIGVNKNFVIKNIGNLNQNKIDKFKQSQKNIFQEIVINELQANKQAFDPILNTYIVDAFLLDKNKKLLNLNEINKENLFNYLSLSLSDEVLDKYNYLILDIQKFKSNKGIMLNLLISDKEDQNVFINLKLLLVNKEDNKIFIEPEINIKEQKKIRSNHIFLSKFLIYNKKISLDIEYENLLKEELSGVYIDENNDDNDFLFNLYENNKKINKHFIFFPILNNFKIHRNFNINNNLIFTEENEVKFNFLNNKKINLYTDEVIFEYDEDFIKDNSKKSNYIVFLKNDKGNLIFDDNNISYSLEKEQKTLIDFLEENDNLGNIFKLEKNKKEKIRDIANDKKNQNKDYFDSLIRKNVDFHDLKFEIVDINFNFLDTNYIPDDSNNKDYSYFLMDKESNKKRVIYLQINIYTKNSIYVNNLFYKITIPESGLENIELTSLSNKK